MLLLGTLVALRLARRWTTSAELDREMRWLGSLGSAIEAPAAASLPTIARGELPSFAGCCNRMQATLPPPAAEELLALIRRHRLDDRLIDLLARRPAKPVRLVAITALGHLRDARAWDELARLAGHPDATLSFAAAHAIIRIDPRPALEILTVPIVQRADWSIARLGTIFEELGPDIVTAPLLTMLVARSRSGLDRVVKLARFGHRSRIAPVVRGWLSSSDDPELIMAALAYVDDLEDLRWAINAASHEDWKVRMAAARALGRIGDKGELEVLLQLLRDPVWWVRFHAAQALTGLKGLEPHELDAAHEDLRDAYAADMLAQALAEMGRRR